MLKVLVTQRVDEIVSRQERRDALDQRWSAFLSDCGAIALPVPNAAKVIPDLWQAIKPDGVILTGGNDLAIVGGTSPERDAAEASLVHHAALDDVPVLGVCRGAQFLWALDGGRPVRQGGHVSVRHPISGAITRDAVNSYHNWVQPDLPLGWRLLARAPDGTVEAARHRVQRRLAIGWHPEREAPFQQQDIELIRSFLSEAQSV